MAFNIVAGVNNAVYGSVSGSGSYVEGAEVTLEVTANDGYRFVSWDDGNTDNPRVFNAIEDVTLVATLEAIPEYAISVTTNNNSLGTVSGAGTFREGTSTQISASPYVHSRFVNWEDGNSDNPRTITVSAAATYKAIFEAVNYFTISTDVNDANLGSVTGAGEYDEGDTVTLTAVPETDCRFVSWNDGNTDNPRTFTSSANATYTATFEEIQYTDVTIASNEQAWGTVSGATSGNIETGTTITLTATPATDYKFDGWQVDGEIVFSSLTASFLVDGQEMDIIAVFSAIVFYQVTLITNDVDCGSISVVSATAEPKGEAHNIWPDGTIINLLAVTTASGKFLNWSTGQVSTEITVNVHENETIRANFYPVTGLILVTKKILQQTWSTIKSFFSASTGASKIGAPANNALGATTLADVVNSVGQPGGIAMLNNSGKVAAADIDGTLSNDTSGNAATASVADKVGTTTVGSSTEPVYINAGVPTACGGSLAVDITGNAATATTATTANSATTAAACSGNAATATTAAACSGNAATATTATNTNNVKLTHAVDNNEKPLVMGSSFVVDDSNQSLKIGVPAADRATCPLRAMAYCAAANTQGEGYIVLGNNIAKTAANNARGSLYMFGSDSYRIRVLSAPAANKDITIATTGGDARTYTLPDATGTIALTSSNITGSSASCTGNAATATKATQDGSGNTITSTYATIAKTYDDTTNTSYRGMRGLDGSTSGWVRTTSSGIIPSQSGAAGSGHCGLGTSSWYFSTAYIDNIYGKLNGNCTGSSASCTGNAATATSATSATTATNANNAKLTHTVGNTEYPLVFGTSFVITDAQQALRIGTPTATAANCALRCKAYCAAANTQGEAYLVCGNNLAKASANNARGSIYLYGTSTAHTQIVPGNNSTSNVVITLPASTGTLALTSSDITGNAATATTASACSGNAATATSATTATNANNLKVTHTGAAWRDILSCATGFTSASNQAVYGHNSGSVAYYVDANATSGNQRAILRLGNATANTTAAGHNGEIWLYSTGTTYNTIKSTCTTSSTITLENNHNITWKSAAAVTLTLPSSTGTLALKSDITSTGVATQKNDDNTYYTVTELTFANSFKMKIVQWKGTALPTADQTITYKVAFAASNSIRAFINANYTKSGSDLILGMGTNSSKAYGGHIADSWASGYSSVHSMVSSNTSFTVATNNNPIYMAIIVGY